MEQWKDIPGYEGLYESSNLGRIRTAEGKTTSNARYHRRVWKQRVMKQKYGKRKGREVKDARVTLWKDGIEKTMLVARLVAMTWCEGYSDGLTVNHKDGNPLNNEAQNLEWITLKENIRHGRRTGLYHNSKGCTLVDDFGNAKHYKSHCEASHGIGRDTSYIANCIRCGRQIFDISGERYYCYDSDS